MLIDNTLLTLESQQKLRALQLGPVDLLSQYPRTLMSPQLLSLLSRMKTAFETDLTVESIRPINIESIRNIFTDFNIDYNDVRGAKFATDVAQMNSVLSYKLGDISVHTLAFNIDISLMAAIMHAIHTFTRMFTHGYSSLQIYICLDDNKRDLDYPAGKSICNIFKHLKRTSSAFNVSGVTDGISRYIILTKKEEIIKLLFHEMVHFIGLDKAARLMVDIPNIHTGGPMNLSEAYTEFMSVLLVAAYQSIHLSKLREVSVIDIYQQMLSMEVAYSVKLSASILRFFRYDADSYTNFFQVIGPAVPKCPIMVWEYILMRTALLQNVNAVSALVGDSWKVKAADVKALTSLATPNQQLIGSLQAPLKQPPARNISYTAIDFNWRLI